MTDDAIMVVCNMQVLVLYPPLFEQSKEQFIYDNQQCPLRWMDVHHRVIWFGADKEDPKPYKRACGLHAHLALRHAELEGWLQAPVFTSGPMRLTPEDLIVPTTAWDSPAFKKSQMDVYLADVVTNFPPLDGSGQSTTDG